jgi:hypothetical protein
MLLKEKPLLKSQPGVLANAKPLVKMVALNLGKCLCPVPKEDMCTIMGNGRMGDNMDTDKSWMIGKGLTDWKSILFIKVNSPEECAKDSASESNPTVTIRWDNSTEVNL